MASLISSVVSFVAESAASAVVQKIVDAGFEFLGNLIQPRDSEAQLKRLKTALPQIRSAMGIAEALKAKDPSYVEWFQQFRNAVDASEDVLDELEYKKLEEEVKRQEAAGGSTSHPKKQKTCPISRETLRRLREAVGMLDQALGDVDRLLQHAKSLGVDDFSEFWKETSKVFRPETTSFLVETKVFGRDEEKEKIIGWLKQSTAEPLSIFGIVGMGGLGKTTLAQIAYQEMKGSNYFEHTIWVCVSIEFSFEGLTRKILGELDKNTCDDKPLNALQETLKEKIQSKKVFLILDDIWDDEKYWRGWEQFIAPLKSTQEGSKILFTTRMNSVADFFARVTNTKCELLKLQGLKEQELGSLFYNYAFHGYNARNHIDLQGLGDQIIKMLWGSPLAAKVIGSLLNTNMDCNYWRRILKHSSILNIDRAKDVVEILKLSYYHLPADLRVCFRFCSIFPRDYEFEKDELIKMWIAVGFIQQKQCNEKQLEDVGEDCFNYLVRKSFLEYFKSWNGERYVMHDLIHDLAQSVSNGECCRVEPNDKPLVIHESVRHISVHENEIERISHLENLHSLIITPDHNIAANRHPFVLPKEIMKKSLRLLKISTSRDCQLSVGISYLVHLRYLSVHTSQSMLISVGIYRLYHLQVLYLDLPGVNIDSSDLGVEPCRMNNLVNLRYMRLSEKLLKTIHGVHKLTSLRELTFFVGEGNGNYINELGTLKDLRKLSIHNIENVGDLVEAKSANLLGKENLRSLSLNWSSDNNPSNSEQIITNLKPNPDLKELIIKNYDSQRYPSWMKDTPVLNLSVLKIHGCPRLKDELFSCHIPYLKILSINQCPELDKLPDMPLSLTEFIISNVGLTSLPNFCQNSSGNTTAIVSQMSPLKIVKIERCFNLISLDGFMQQANMDLQAIEQLEINNCVKLMYLPTQGFRNLTSLKSLKMGKCPNLTICLNLPHSLNNLEIQEVALSAIPSLPLSVTNLKICEVPVHALPEFNTGSNSSSDGPSTESLKSSIRYVNIEKCQNITSLNGFLQHEYVDLRSLKTMRISKCRNLEQLPKDAFGKFLSLIILIIRDCPMLKALNDQSNLLPITVKFLSIRNCGQLDVQLLKSASHLSALNRLQIENCANITHIPWSENAFRSLTRLDISGCDKLIEHSSGEPLPGVNKYGINLASLKINYLRIDSLSLLLGEPLRSLRFVSELAISNCSEMDSFLQQWLLQSNSTLRSLTFKKATLKSLPGAIPRLTALERLEIIQFDLLEKIQELTSSLRRLQISDAKSLKSLPATMVSLAALEHLHIGGADLLEELPELPASLRYLRFQGAKSLKSLPATMVSLTALEHLYIYRAFLLEELPELPASLRYLVFGGAKSLKSVPATMASLTALQRLIIDNADLLQELPELPRSLRDKSITRSDGTELCK